MITLISWCEGIIGPIPSTICQIYTIIFIATSTDKHVT